jgi:hypothetical protein
VRRIDLIAASWNKMAQAYHEDHPHQYPRVSKRHVVSSLQVSPFDSSFSSRAVLKSVNQPSESFGIGAL